jgi:hypothetical protein
MNANEIGTRTHDASFDLLTLRMRSVLDFTDDSGVTRRIETSERRDLPTELTWYMLELGMEDTHVFGCTVGNLQKRPPTPEDFELMVIAQKPL